MSSEKDKDDEKYGGIVYGIVSQSKEIVAYSTDWQGAYDFIIATFRRIRAKFPNKTYTATKVNANTFDLHSSYDVSIFGDIDILEKRYTIVKIVSVKYYEDRWGIKKEPTKEAKQVKKEPTKEAKQVKKKLNKVDLTKIVDVSEGEDFVMCD